MRRWTKMIAFVAVLSLMATTAWAEIHVNPLFGTVGSLQDNGQVAGHSFQPTGNPQYRGGGLLYDNFFNGNAGTVNGVPAQFVFVDWAPATSTAQYGDDLHAISEGGNGPAVITAINYAYLNNVASSTHTIKIYAMDPPSVSHGTQTSLIDKGPLLTSVLVRNLPTGANSVSVTGLNLQLPNSAVWIKFDESGVGAPNNFWLTGGVPGPGYSHPGLTYTVKDYYAPGEDYNLFVPLPYFEFSYPQRFVQSNISLALSGFHVPEPSTIGLLGVFGAMILGWRRGV